MPVIGSSRRPARSICGRNIAPRGREYDQMTERILGPEGSKRRRRFLWVPTLLIACTALFVIASAQAVHDTGRFQLDGDAASGANTAGTPAASDDWDKVC